MPPIMVISKDGQGHKDKYLDTTVAVGRSCHKKCSCAIWKLSYIYNLEIMTNVNLKKS